jgi:hypothetical protein
VNDREGTSEDGGEGDDDHEGESGESGAEFCGEEGGRHNVCEERIGRDEDDDNNKREGELAKIGRNVGDPTVCMLPARRVGEHVDPTARTRPGGEMEMTGGKMDVNPTTRMLPDRESDHLTGGNNLQTAQMMTDGENGLLTSGRRERGPPVWMQDYVTGKDLSEYESNMALIMSSDPIHFEDAVKIKHWRLAMNSEINAIEKNNTWTLNELPEGAKKIGVKWVYKTKYNEHEDINKYKARLVAKGYSQQHGIDYT